MSIPLVPSEASVTAPIFYRPARSGFLLRSRWSPWLLSALIWLGVGLVFATYRLDFSAGTEALWRSVRKETAFWLPWAPLTPALAWLSRRLAVYWERRDRRFVLAIPLAVLAVTAHALLAVTAARLFAIKRAEGNLVVQFVQALRGSWPWETLVCVCIIGFSIAAQYVRRIQSQEREAADLRRQLVEAQLATLRTQLQPHFLFNSLHAISVLVASDPDAASAMIARLGDLLRATLDEAHRQEVPLREELALLEMYLEILRMRFGDRLSIQIDASPDALDCKVPGFLLQPLVENAVQHGIEAKVGAGSIQITARRDGANLKIWVIDDGGGVPQEAQPERRRGIGIANTRERLQKLYGGAHRLALESQPDGRTAAVIEIPEGRLNA